MDVDLVVNSLESDDMLFSVEFACWMEVVHVLELLLFSRSSICDWIIFHSSCSFVADSIDDDMIIILYSSLFVISEREAIAARAKCCDLSFSQISQSTICIY